MEFDKSRCYSALNADELHKGDKVIVADTMSELKIYVEVNAGTLEIDRIEDDNCINRFTTTNMNSWRVHFPLAYLVERAEDCTNCIFKDNPTCNKSKWPEEEVKLFRCEDYQPKTEKKAERHYRPFKNIDELVKVWDAKYKHAYGLERINNGLDMPLVWVRRKDCNGKGQLITKFSDPLWVIMSTEAYNMTNLFEHFTFLDSSPCGVEE